MAESPLVPGQRFAAGTTISAIYPSLAFSKWLAEGCDLWDEVLSKNRDIKAHIADLYDKQAMLLNLLRIEKLKH